MTSLQLSVLARAAGGDKINPGTAMMYEYQRGRIRQVKWLVGRKLCRVKFGRLIATRDGRKILDWQRS
jgi:hypothetical protein